MQKSRWRLVAVLVVAPTLTSPFAPSLFLFGIGNFNSVNTQPSCPACIQESLIIAVYLFTAIWLDYFTLLPVVADRNGPIITWITDFWSAPQANCIVPRGYLTLKPHDPPLLQDTLNWKKLLLTFSRLASTAQYDIVGWKAHLKWISGPASRSHRGAWGYCSK